MAEDQPQKAPKKDDMRPRVTLSVTKGPLAGIVYTFSERTTALIGRALDCNILLPDDDTHRTISRHHCLLDINPPRARIRDLGSMNGTYISGRIIGQRAAGATPEEGGQKKFPEYDLHDKDEIMLGGTVFKVRISAPTACAECGTNIPEQLRGPATLREGLYLCPKCRRDATKVRRVESKPFRNLICISCGKQLSRKTSMDSQTNMCPECRGNPVASLRVLMLAARKGEPSLTALKNLTVVKGLGRGTSGAAFLVRKNQTGRHIALKVLLPEMAAQKWAKASFLREVDNTKALNHPNVVRLFDSGSYHGLFFYTMEYCHGGSIEHLRLKHGGRLPLEMAMDAILQALEGLDYIHHAEIPKVKLADGSWGRGRGLVHRDLKPANIFLAGSKDQLVAKVADVGVGKAFDTAGLSGQTMTGSVAGSPVVTPRQQVINFKYAKPDVDVWAMAASLYNLLTGDYPRDFPENQDPWRVVLETQPVPIRKRLPAIPAELANVIDRALIDNPEIIFKSARDFKEALQAVYPLDK